MRLGLFGGTFDPVHYGHLLLAEQCREQCRLDEVRFIPAGVPPHKSGQPITSGKHRVAMLQLATAGQTAFSVDTREIKREGYSYTVDTLAHFREERPDCELFFLIGADSLNDLPQWREPERIVELATLIAINRGEGSFDDAAAAKAHLPKSIAARIEIITMPRIDLASSDIRRRKTAGQSVRYMVPPAVDVYISQHQLYLPTTDVPATDEAGRP